MSLHIDGQQVWVFIPKQLAMIFFIFLPQPFILKQDDFVKLHSNGPDSILYVSGAPKTRHHHVRGHGDFVHFCVHPCGKEFDNKTALFLQTELSLTSYERAHIVRVGLHMVWYDSKKWFVKLGPATSIMFSLLVSTHFCCCSLSSAKKDCFTLAVFNCELGFSSGMINWSLNWSWQLLLIPGHLCNNVLEVNVEISISWSVTSVHYLFPIL